MLVRGHMTPDPVTVGPSQTLFEALKLTRDHQIRYLPVVEGDRLVGLVSGRGLRDAVPAKGTASDAERDRILTTVSVRDIMVAEVITTAPDTPVEWAAKLLYRHKIGCLPVVAGGELVGILTETDLLRAFVELFGAREPSSRLEIRIPNRPGELSRVVRLIGIQFKLNISGMVIPPVRDDEAVLIVHIRTLDPSAIIEALENMGYAVGWPTLDRAFLAPDGAVDDEPAPAARGA